ncbi:MAG: response regulator transcription factor [Melioribacter sp.]|nr:response regulator transcription factor [Melioribacter sp.]
MKKIRILFADDHAIVRDGLRLLFKSEPQFTVVGEASNGVEALELIAKHKPDVAVLDISMPKLNGIEATKIIKNKYPDTRILILTIHENEEYIQQMILAGADGYVLKNAEKKEIFDGVRSVAHNETFFSPSVSKVLLEGLIKRTRNKEIVENDNYNKLTKREMEVFQLIAEGLTSKEISHKLFLSISTVNSHRMNIMKKLDIHDIASLVKYAIQKNLIAVKQ